MHKLMKTKSIITSIVTFVLFTSLSAQKPYRGAEVYSSEQVLYGRFEMSMKMIKGSGMLSTFFTYKSGSEQSGTFWEEIDIEVLGKDNASAISTNIITDGLSGSTDHAVEEIHTDMSLADTFHTYTLEWTPDSVVWYLDGEVIRSETDSVVQVLSSPQSYRFNAWISCEPSWVGSIDASVLPQYQYIDWVEYHSYDTINKEFTQSWRDDFETFNTSQWNKANWTFDCNEVSFIPENAYIEDDKLVLAITDPSPATNVEQHLKSQAFFDMINSRISNEIEIQFRKEGSYTVQLLDAQGRIAQKHTVQQGTSHTIPYHHLNPGVYLINVQSKDHSAAQKVIIE